MRTLAIATLLLATACTVSSDEGNNVDVAASDADLAGTAGGADPQPDEPGAPPTSPAPQQPGTPPVQPQPSGEVSLRADPTSASAGATINLTLTNGSDEPIGYNLCTSRLQQSAGGGWRAVATDRICTMELRTLRPGGQTRHGWELPGNLADGRYRFTTNIERMDSAARGSATSNSFTVN